MLLKDEFYKKINTRLTVACQIPFEVPEEAMDVIVDTTKEWFYRNYEDALQNLYLAIPNTQWQDDCNLKNDRSLVLPSSIYSVHMVAKDSKNMLAASAYGEFSLSKYLNSHWSINAGFQSPEDSLQSDAAVSYVVASSWGDLMTHIFNFPISYSFNKLTNKLFLKGDLKGAPSFLLDCDVRIPDEALFANDLFFNYVLGECYMSIGDILGTFSMNLPGGATINTDKLYEKGEKLITDVKEEIKDQSSNCDFFYTSGAGW